MYKKIKFWNKSSRIVYLMSMCILISIYSSCNDDLLEQSNPNLLTTQDFWQSADDAEFGLVGAYSPLSVIRLYGRILGLHTMLKSDAARPYLSGCCHNAANFTNVSSDSRNREIWQQFWKIVFRANQVIENVPNIEMDQTQKNHVMGQAYFLRAFAGFNLMNLFENIPFTTQAAETIEEILGATQIGPDQIRPILISDLELAKSLLPPSWSAGDLGRATSGAAAGMLGKVYLYNNDWALAAGEFEDVINGVYGNYDLVADYAQLFSTPDSDNSVESLFEIQFESNEAALWGEDIANVDRAAVYGMDIAAPGFTNQAATRVNQWVLDAFLAETTIGGEIDPRAKATLAWDYPGSEYYSLPWSEAVDVITPLVSGSEGTGVVVNDLVFIRKHLKFGDGISGPLSPNRTSNDINFKILRFADVLLMYAEAQNELNNTSDALAALKRVRDRSDMPEITETDQDALRQLIRNERVLELTFEGDRFQDLKRWGILTERFTPGDTNDLRFDGVAGDFDPNKHDILPIPQVDVDANPDVLNQNPGY